MSTLRHAIDIAPLGPLADPATIVRLAVAAEARGWDGVSVWDSLGASIGSTAADRSSPSPRWHPGPIGCD
jgi:hypothetical protein